MSSRVVVTLICILLVTTKVQGRAIQNSGGSPNNFDLTSYTPQGALEIYNRNNHVSQSLVSSSPTVFLPAYPHAPSVSLVRPLPSNESPGRHVSRIPAAQSGGISFNQNPGQQGGSLYVGAVTFGRPHTSVSFGGGPDIFPGSVPSTSNKPDVTNFPDFSGPLTTSANVDPSPTNGSPLIYFPDEATEPGGGSRLDKPKQSVLPSQPTNASRKPTSFEGGRDVLPIISSSIETNPVFANVPDFSGAVAGSTEFNLPQTTHRNLGASSKKGRSATNFQHRAVSDFNLPKTNGDSNCLVEDGSVYFNGNCERLLSRAFCPEDHWLLLDGTGSPYCAFRKCSSGYLNYRGNCVDPVDSQVCGRGQILYVDLTGFVECDCEPDFIYDSYSGNCFGIHEQGFCDPGLYLERNYEGKFVCVTNPCFSDKYVEHQGHCYEKNYRGYCPQNQVFILPQLATADCPYIVPHSILNIPKFTECPPGSKRDFLQQCRGVFRASSLSSFPTSRGGCPAGFVKDPTGICRKLVNLFG